MEEKILSIIKEINIKNVTSANNNLIDQGAISKIIINQNKISFALDIGILGIDAKAGQNIITEITNKIKNVTSDVVNIILTSSQPKVDRSSGAEQRHPVKNQSEKIPGIKNIIVVASGKGGVGKSTVAVNLAISLKKIGFKIGLVDADIYGPSVAYLMNLSGKPEAEKNLMLPINNYGIDCISIGSIIDDKKATVWRGPMITKALHQLIAGTKWVDIDYLIIDLPPGTGDVHLSLVQTFPISGAVIVSTPQNVAIIDVIKSIDMFKTLQVPILGVVQNMAYLLDEKTGEKNYLFGKDGAKQMSQDLGIKFLGDICLDIKIREAGDNKNPITNSHPNSAIAFDYGRIAENVLDELKN